MKCLRLISENMSLVLNLKLVDGTVLQIIEAEKAAIWCWPWILKNQLKNKLTGQCPDCYCLGIFYIQCHMDPNVICCCSGLLYSADKASHEHFWTCLLLLLSSALCFNPILWCVPCCFIFITHLPFQRWRVWVPRTSYWMTSGTTRPSRTSYWGTFWSAWSGSTGWKRPRGRRPPNCACGTICPGNITGSQVCGPKQVTEMAYANENFSFKLELPACLFLCTKR